jgi:hypothetical protein
VKAIQATLSTTAQIVIIRRSRYQSYQWLLALAVLAVLVVGAWASQHSYNLFHAARSPSGYQFLFAAQFYLVAHVLRMARLALLSLDARAQAAPLALMHGGTAFVSFFIPWKLGEFLRLVGFCTVIDKQKALSIWLCERFADLAIITTLLFVLQFSANKPPVVLQKLLIVFSLAGLFALLFFLALSRMLNYLRRHLILTSLSERSLRTLKFSHTISELENQIKLVLEGRVLGLIFLSIAIWIFELYAINTALAQYQQSDYLANFSQSIFMSLLPSTNPQLLQFSLFQQAVLAMLMLCSIALAWRQTRAKGAA